MRRIHFKHFFSFIFFLVIIAGCAHQSLPYAVRGAEKKKQQRIFVVKNVNVIPMTSEGTVLQNATVVVIKDSIASINGPVPPGAETIDGSGKWLIPGLIDMHVHVPANSRFTAKIPTQGANLFFNTQDIMTPYIANGVTTIFELTAKPEHFGQRNEIESGDVIGPRMALAALINGGDGAGRVVNTPSDGRQAVRSAKAEGYEFIKLYSSLNVETFKAIVDEANKQGLKTIGHIPDAFRGRLKEAFVPHFGMVAHAEEFSKQSTEFTDGDAQRFAQLIKDNGTWLSPTLVTMVWILSQARSLDELRAAPALQYVHPLLQSKWLTANNYNRNTSPDRVAYFEKLINFHIRLVRACKAAGVPIVAGTDTGVSGVIAGFALHDEIELLVAAGLTTQEALISATRLPAEWLGIDSITGTVETGKRADLILLDANPLADIKNTRKIAGVFINGRWLTRARIDALLSDLATRNTASNPDYDWKKMTGK